MCAYCYLRPLKVPPLDEPPLRLPPNEPLVWLPPNEPLPPDGLTVALVAPDDAPNEPLLRWPPKVPLVRLPPNVVLLLRDGLVADFAAPEALNVLLRCALNVPWLLELEVDWRCEPMRDDPNVPLVRLPPNDELPVVDCRDEDDEPMVNVWLPVVVPRWPLNVPLVRAVVDEARLVALCPRLLNVPLVRLPPNDEVLKPELLVPEALSRFTVILVELLRPSERVLRKSPFSQRSRMPTKLPLLRKSSRRPR